MLRVCSKEGDESQAPAVGNSVTEKTLLLGQGLKDNGESNQKEQENSRTEGIYLYVYIYI